MATKNKGQPAAQDQSGAQGQPAQGAQNQSQSQGEQQDPWAEWEPGAQPPHSAPATPTAPTPAPQQPNSASETTGKAEAARTQAAPQTPAPAPTAAPATIRKGIYLSALIYVEGDLPPAADFIGPATAAVKKAISSVPAGDHAGLSMTLKSVDVQNNAGDAEGKAKLGGESKFQF